MDNALFEYLLEHLSCQRFAVFFGNAYREDDAVVGLCLLGVVPLQQLMHLYFPPLREAPVYEVPVTFQEPHLHESFVYYQLRDVHERTPIPVDCPQLPWVCKPV